ncbi:hypothetical protein TVAG_224620 [Trichomonas vaginalis G3]|uniref:Uncharacterized protein n=1 Tax=Trichomonas vaginalis (strain ATCC PRA-98 / G3) TaxID=412133 RepID=A2DW85_TRIV3|nr:hypothetical protein TVAGG3_0804270 [Trichomonas vaginalis G3]EAY15386.1 hypothetical protein TVAG_224620 [Trichomonas vaginalis G3]KAI5496739.1 hypothetical protein TVAGG3_0804270 [Trichomonas vaginalis G3]|eukprot:XP_001327609.1 hypothetical protein [Trichomonas vaginalis G3]
MEIEPNFGLQKQILKEMHKQKVDAVNRWFKEQNYLEDRILQKQLSIIEKRKENTMKKFYADQETKIMDEFRYFSNNEDIKTFVQTNPSDDEEFKALKLKMHTPPKQVGKRKEKKANPDAIKDSLDNLLHIAENEMDLKDTIIVADYGIYYKGTILRPGTKCFLKTRGQKGLKTTIFAITDLIVTFEFEDSGIMSVPSELIESEKVCISLNLIS